MRCYFTSTKMIKIKNHCNSIINKKYFLKVIHTALAMGLSWLEHCPIHQKVAGSIPALGTYLGCGFDPQLHHVWETTNQSLSLSLSLSLPLSLSLVRIKKDCRH